MLAFVYISKSAGGNHPAAGALKQLRAFVSSPLGGAAGAKGANHQCRGGKIMDRAHCRLKIAPNPRMV
jgi:hypothetical protein